MKLFHNFNTWLNKHARKLESARFGLLTMYNAIQSCVGSIALMKVMQNGGNVFLLAVCTSLTMASNSVFIAQGSMKLCLIVFYLSIIINNIILFANA